jgi:ABC-2 type transport system permease protein
MNIGIIFKRELDQYLRSPMGYVIGALVLLVDGLLFYKSALSPDHYLLSAEALSRFFLWASGPTAIAAVALSMRLVAEERGQGTLVLLHSSPVRDVEIVVGKFLAAFVFLVGLTLLTIYLPLLLKIRGKITWGQMGVGYIGLCLYGGAILAIGLFASCLVRYQVVALVVAGAIAGTLYLCWPLSKVLEPPLSNVFASLSLFERHFPPFSRGTLHLRDLFYYVALTYFFLLLAVKTLEEKRWQ